MSFIFCKPADSFDGNGSGTPPHDIQVCNLSFVHFDDLTPLQARITYESWVLPVIFVVYNQILQSQLVLYVCRVSWWGIVQALVCCVLMPCSVTG